MCSQLVTRDNNRGRVEGFFSPLPLTLFWKATCVSATFNTHFFVCFYTIKDRLDFRRASLVVRVVFNRNWSLCQILVLLLLRHNVGRLCRKPSRLNHASVIDPTLPVGPTQGHSGIPPPALFRPLPSLLERCHHAPHLLLRRCQHVQSDRFHQGTDRPCGRLPRFGMKVAGRQTNVGLGLKPSRGGPHLNARGVGGIRVRARHPSLDATSRVR